MVNLLLPQKMTHVYLGPAYSTEECIEACERHSGKPAFERVDDVPGSAARLLVAGKINEQTNPRYHALLEEVETLTGHGAVLNTSMNRRGEPMVCSPTDALNMFFGSDLEFLFLEDLLVTRQQTG